MIDSLSKYRRKTVVPLLFEIETSLDNIILNQIAPFVESKNIADENEVEKLVELIQKNEYLTEGIYEKQKIAEIFLRDEKSFNSKITCIMKNKNVLEIAEQELFSRIYAELSTTINEIRNRCFHNDSITEEYQTAIYDFCRALSSSNSKNFTNVKAELKNITPDIVLNEADEKLINFPPPDYIWHKFVGREDIYKSVLRLLKNGKPQINIYGPGGYGKSAFVDYLCRQLEQEDTYEKIIWYSDKRQEWNLDKNTVKEMDKKTSFEDFIEMPIENEELSLEEITRKYKCLVVVDNLETIQDEAVKFIDEFSRPDAQFITTSRVMPEAGSNQKLSELKEEDSIILLKDINRTKLLKEIDELDDEKLYEIVRKLNNAPLNIKWFLESVDRGKVISSIPNDQSKIAEYCFTGVLETLHEEERKVLDIFRILDEPISIIQLSHLSSISLNHIEEITNKLYRNSLIKKEHLANASNQFILNNDIRLLLREDSLEDLKKNLELKNDINEMNKRMSQITADARTSVKNFNDDESLEISNKEDAFVAWRIHEIFLEYKENIKYNHATSEPKMSQFNALKLQVNSFENLLEILPNDSQINMCASIAYNYDKQFDKALEYAKKSLKLSQTDFKKKKALFFLSRLCDRTKNFHEGISYAKELYKLDKGANFASLSEYVNMLIGNGQRFEAIRLLIEDIENRKEPSSEYEANFILMKVFGSTLAILSYNSDMERKDFAELYELLRKILPLCSKWADNRALIDFVKTVHKFGISYGWYLERSMRVKSLDVNNLVNEFLDLVRINGEQDLRDFFNDVDFNSNNQIQNLLNNLGAIKEVESEVIKRSFETGEPFDARVAAIRNGKNGNKIGYRLETADNYSLIIKKHNANPDLKVGEIRKFIPIKYDKQFRNPWIVKSFDLPEDISFIDEIKEKEWKQLKVGMVKDGNIRAVKDYGIFVDIGSFSGLIHKSEISSEIISSDYIHENFKIGQAITSKIIKLDETDGKKISLSIIDV